MVKEIVLLSESTILASSDRPQLLRHEQAIPLLFLAEQFHFAALQPQPDNDNTPLLEEIALITTVGEDLQRSPLTVTGANKK
ncbi:hypothetical protein HC928_24675 [bacterium]|nr:hypothetical protein [bacterium]